MSKTLCKAIMRKSSLKIKYFKTRSNDSFKEYKKLKNICSKLYKKEKKEFFRNLNLSFVTDSKNFWKVVKPLFTEKGSAGGNKIVSRKKLNLLMMIRKFLRR